VLRLLVAVLVLYVVFYAVLAAWVLARLQRVDALRAYDERPGNVRGQTWLLVGSDSREGLTAAERRRLRTGSDMGQRTDTILLLHAPTGAAPTLVGLPRDSYITIPSYVSGGRERPAQQDKLNAAFSLGGAPLLVRTVESATGMRVDHFMEVGFAGVVSVVDAVGGVELCLDEPIRDRRSALDVPAGCQVMNGATSLGYVRARYFDPRGDLGRVQRQQGFLAALVDEVASPFTLLNPIAMGRLAEAGTRAVRVDPATGPVDLAGATRAMARVSGGGGTSTTVPLADPDARTPVGSAVLWDEDRAEAFFHALRAGRRPPTTRP
jgi:LCP family protein required for cell wall assembly